MAEALPWRELSGLPPARTRVALGPLAGAGEPLGDVILPMPTLVARKAASGDLAAFKARVKALPEARTQTLIARISVTDDALLLWAIHCVLAGRGIAPALRWPGNTDDPQNELITFAAEVHWLARRSPEHQPKFRGWARTLACLPGSPDWHLAVHRQFLYVASRGSVAHLCAVGLALTDRQRQESMLFPTTAMQADRRHLQPERFEEIRARLLAHAMEHPDRSGTRPPHDVAARRAALWRVYVLSCRNKAAMVRNWHSLTGECVSRQALDRQVHIVEDLLGRR